MNIKVYQIGHERDANRVSFESYDKTIEYACCIDPSIYNTVFEGEVECSNLEDIYELFNTCHPVTHLRHSLSVSDIVEIIDSVDAGCYYCDSIGFTKLTSFNSKIVQPIQGVRMLVVEPHKPPYEARIKDDYRSWQRVVGGCFECTYPFQDCTFVISNDEAKLIGMEGNRRINGDIYAGVFMVAAEDGTGGVKDLSDEQIQSYTKMFEADENFTQDDVEV